MKLAKDLDIAVSPRMSEVKKPLPKIKKQHNQQNNVINIEILEDTNKKQTNVVDIQIVQEKRAEIVKITKLEKVPQPEPVFTP